MYQNYLNMQPLTTANGPFPNIYSTGRQEIVKVNGENGARAYQIAPNSSALLLDETGPIIWLLQTDGAGYKTVTPYSITPYKPEPPVDLTDIAARLKKLEERVNESDNFSNEFAGNKSNTIKNGLDPSKSNK